MSDAHQQLTDVQNAQEALKIANRVNQMQARDIALMRPALELIAKCQSMEGDIARRCIERINRNETL